MKKVITLLVFSCVSFATFAQPGPFEIREAIAASIEQVKSAPTPVDHITSFEVSGREYSIPVRVYYPTKDGKHPILYHIHGGAWIGGNLDTHDNICRRLAAETNSIVVAVDYRRPPEHMFPVALDDCGFILKWISENTEKLGGDGRLFLIGDSAGGGMTPSLLARNANSETPVKVDGQILINPATDLRPASASDQTYHMFIEWYVPEGTEIGQSDISPLVFDSFDKFPKTLIVVSENDEIRSDGVRFHEKLIENGNSSIMYEMKGIGHLGPLWAGDNVAANPGVEFVIAEYKKWLEQ